MEPVAAWTVCQGLNWKIVGVVSVARTLSKWETSVYAKEPTRRLMRMKTVCALLELLILMESVKVSILKLSTPKFEVRNFEIEVCDENCVDGHFDETTGCSLCKVGFETSPLCCDCIGDRVGPDCRCPSDTVENPDTGECEICLGDLEPLNGVCDCPNTTIRDGTSCISKQRDKILKHLRIYSYSL